MSRVEGELLESRDGDREGSKEKFSSNISCALSGP